MISPPPATGPVPQGGPGARQQAAQTSSAALAALYAPVIALLTADRGEQINRVAAMMLAITEARDAEGLAKKGDFALNPDQQGAKTLDQKYKPLIAILLATRDRQYEAVRHMQMQIRAARDAENMAARGIGTGVPGRPTPLMSPGMAALLTPQGGVSASLGAPATPGPGLAVPQTGPPRDREGIP